MIYIIDNNEDYSAHIISFVSTDGLDDKDAKKLIEAACDISGQSIIGVVELVEWRCSDPIRTVDFAFNCIQHSEKGWAAFYALDISNKTVTEIVRRIVERIEAHIEQWSNPQNATQQAFLDSATERLGRARSIFHKHLSEGS